jgi:hypothetical protein
MRQTTSQIQKKVLIIIALALASAIAKAQSQNETDYTAIALAEEENNTVALETSVMNISSAFASEKVLEIGKTYIMGNNKTATQETIGTNVETTITANSSEVHGISDENFLYVLNRTIEETKRAKIENTYLRLMQKH